jgi:hypothetical protein
VPAFYVVADRLKSRLARRLGSGESDKPEHPSHPDEPRPAEG